MRRDITMKKEKITILTTIVFLFLCISAVSLNAIEVVPESGPYYTGDVIKFRPSSNVFSYANVVYWDFGDGVKTTAKGMQEMSHSFSTAGTFTVRVSTSSLGRLSPSITPTTETLSIQIQAVVDNRYITVSPAQPIAGQVATFTAFNFNTPDNIRWDMGDGTIIAGIPQGNSAAMRAGAKGRPGSLEQTAAGSIITHTYTTPGTYTVRAYDNGGDTNTPISLRVTVQMPQRIITYSPAQPLAGAPVQFNAANFLSSQIDWNFGDGTTVSAGSISVTHVYNNAGNFTVTAKETNSNYNPVSVIVTVTMPDRRIVYDPRSPRVDQLVYFRAENFLTGSIDWNFGDGTVVTGGSAMVSHRYMSEGTFIVSAKDSSINHTPITRNVVIFAENRYITVSPPEARTNDTITVQAFNFRGNYILWDFGDGRQVTGLQTETHVYSRAGTYIITARDEGGESQVPFTAQVVIKGIDDVVNLEVAELRLDNGKYYKVVSKNSKNLQAVLRMKMRGTGIISGFWAVDGHPYEFFSEVVSQGLVKEIFTRRIPGLPVTDPGIHQVTIHLTRPEIDIQFPILKYYVLPYENIVKPLTPPDGFVAKDKEIPVFSWEATKGANKYRVTFSNDLYPIMSNGETLNWIDVGPALTFTPGEQLWNGIERNRWTYWKVLALNTYGEVVAESDIMDIKVVIATANINIEKVTDLEGNDIPVDNGNIRTTVDDLLVHGSIEYAGDSEYLVLRVYVDNEISDQLLFRDVKKGEKRFFETSVPHKNTETRLFFRVLKTSSPAVVVGIQSLVLKK
jgi:PKD repeat protein